jgi:diacylglycerol kinase (CTP)
MHFLTSCHQKSSNGVIWYLLGANTALIAFPLDIAVVSVLMYVHSYLWIVFPLFMPLDSLSWADTAASTFGRLWGPLTPPLPARLLGLPLAPRKSMAGFIAATVTGAAVAAGFWTYIAPIRDNLTWSWDAGVSSTFSGASVEAGGVFSEFTGLAVVTLWAGLVSGVAEALGGYLFCSNLVCAHLGCRFGFCGR